MIYKLYDKKYQESKLDTSFDLESEQAKHFFACCNLIAKYVRNVFPILHDNENRLLVEGAQGALLDMDHGTYPYVTSSNPTIGGISSGLGIPISKFQSIIGIFKDSFFFSK